MLKTTTLSLILGLALTTFAPAQEDLTGIKCVMNGAKAASPDASVDYKDGKVYFCCDHCADEFRKDVKLGDQAQFTIKANHQLVLTGQYVQKGCPMSGGAIDENLIAEVGGTKVGFCCEGCCNKVKNAADLEAKAKLVFAKSAFKKAFEKKQPEVNLADIKCMMMPKNNVVADQAVDYLDGKVYFCCQKCAQKFSDDPEKYATQANQQLVTTGQFLQTGCPISGGDVDDDQASEISGVTIKFCCDKCKAKVDGATTDEAKAELVFGKKRFDKAFSKK